MEHYVTYHKILDLCEQFQKQSPILKSFGYGNLVDFGKTTSGTTTQYPFMFMVPQSITYDENTTSYQFSILFADILNTDLDNEKDIVSDMSLEARRFISFIKRGMNQNPPLYDFMDVQMGVQAIPFQERFNDHTCGIAINPTIIVFEDINACDYYESPTPTPTNTATLTPTPTSTSGPCVGEILVPIGNALVFTAVDCDGVPINYSGNPASLNVCYKQGTLVITSGTSIASISCITPTPTLTPTPTCPITTQYLEVQLEDNTKFKLILWNQPDFTSPANALCDYVISGTAFGSSGTTYSGIEQIDAGQHQHQFNLAPVLQLGEVVTGFTVHNVNTSSCVCPVDVVYCGEYQVTCTAFSVNVTYTDCDGNLQSFGLVNGQSQIVSCALLNSITYSGGGNATITYNGPCS